ncbi:ATP-binding cassette domain-containing protein [Acidovorax sp. GBBC 3334]|uniref:ABC transporter ATP-binding protein n=1 Tax=Acidovorax sp. GBBC 3334 TaxID=2940496 RepID=UPI0023027922|nr:ATP-binding cassette domain-containing protein [Acidovorax sp. GBBC 3334]MDA8457240.1 ATP-binding cassette domain-containing protein [Acidovorax sp. GBBC 3334]
MTAAFDAHRPVPSTATAATNAAPALWECRGLCHVPPGADGHLFAGLDLRILPGTTLLRGGDGRGKTTLLRIIAGEVLPQAGTVVRTEGAALCWMNPRAMPGGALDTGHGLPGEPQTPQDWWAEQAARWPQWNAEALAAHIGGFGLAEHAGKRMEQLSTGTRRKVLLAAGFASGAAMVLVDEPVSGLDRPSVGYLRQVLAEVSAKAFAAPACRQAVVVAHYDTLGGVPWGRVVDLGD